LLDNIKSTVYGPLHSRGSFGPVSFILPFLVIPAGGSCDAGPAQISFTIKMDRIRIEPMLVRDITGLVALKKRQSETLKVP
jgi:hypothetical protein